MAINNVKSTYVVVAFAWAIHAISWFLPVVKLGEWRDLVGPVRGWTAFRFALSPIWPGDFGSADTWYGVVLTIASAATTFLFIVGSPLAVWWGSRSVLKTCAWVATAAFILNSDWYVLGGSDRKVLSVGYFLWWFSFSLLAVGLFGLSSNSTVKKHRHLTQTEAQEPT